MDEEFPAFIMASPVYGAPVNPQDSVEKTWVVVKRERVRCVMMQRRQGYREAFDSLSMLLGDGRPVWRDSSSTTIQTVWDDGYVTWWLGGHWYPDAYPVVITVMATEPVGKRFDSSAPELC